MEGHVYNTDSNPYSAALCRKGFFNRPFGMAVALVLWLLILSVQLSAESRPAVRSAQRGMRSPMKTSKIMAVNSTVRRLDAMADLKRQTLAPINITGTVTDSLGNPLAGVTVKLKNGVAGTVTDAAGNYAITVPSDGILIMSYIGYETKEVPVNNRTQINVTLNQQTISGKEVVVVGYLTQSKSDLIGSVSTLGADDLQRDNTNNFVDMIQGKATGTYISSNGQPGDAPTILIRGMGSISGGSSPLYVVDGVISSYNQDNSDELPSQGGFTNTFNAAALNIDPADIKSINVLKGPAATAIYGARAANGVIEITTKSGNPQGKTTVDVSVSYGINKALKGNLYYMNGTQFKGYYHDLGIPLPDYVDTTANTDWFNLIYPTGVIQKYHVAVSGGNDKNQFYISGNMYKNKGPRLADKYRNYSFMANYKHIFNDKFTLDVRSTGYYVKRDQYLDVSGSGLLNLIAYTGVPWDKPYKEDGTPVQGIIGKNWLTRDAHNPIYLIRNSFNKNTQYQFSLQPRLTYNITDYLTFTSNNNLSFNDILNESYLSKHTLAGEGTNGSLSNSNANITHLETSDLLTFKKPIGNHHINAVLGFEYQQKNAWLFGATGAGIDNFDVLNAAATPYNVQGTKNEFAFVSQFLQVNYNYNRTYYFTGSFRRDGSSRFGSDNQYGNFYALGGAWVISNEPFFNVKAINQLRLQIDYGTTGNAEIGNYAAQSLQSYGLTYNGGSGSFPSTLGNPRLTWEKQYGLDVGLELGLLKSRLNLTLTGYQKKSVDLLQEIPLPYESGFSSQLQNVGVVRNRGLEAMIAAVVVQTDNFQWTLNMNGTYNKNEVLSLYQDKSIINDTKIIQVGSPINTWYMPKWGGVNPENGLPQWERIVENPNGGKEVTLTSDYNKATYQTVGASIPKWYGGISTHFSYKGISLNALFTYIGGYKVYGLASFNGGDQQANQLDISKYPDRSRWETPGQQATEPKLKLGGYNAGSSTHNLFTGNHLRLKQLRIAYQFPDNVLQRLKLNALSVYVEGGNLWTHLSRDYIGPDPEENLDASEGARTKYPNTKTLMFGIQLNF